MKTAEEYANKCLHEMNFGSLSTTQCVAKYLELYASERLDSYKESIRSAIDDELADAREELRGATGSHDIAEIDSRIVTLKKVIKLIISVTPKEYNNGKPKQNGN